MTPTGIRRSLFESVPSQAAHVPVTPESAGYARGERIARQTDFTVEVVASYAGFIALEAAWNQTVERAGMTHPFLRHEWLRTWWECFGAGRALQILVVRANNRIVAIAPLMAETTLMYGVPVRRIDLLHNDHTPRADFIVAERAAESYRAIWNALRTDVPRWDVLCLGRLPRESATLNAMAGLAAVDGRGTGRWHGDVAPFLTLNDTWDDYLASLSAKFRSNVRNRISRLTRLGTPRLEVLRDPAEIQAACPDALRLEASGWKQEAATSIRSDSSVERFYTLLAARSTRSDWLRLTFLTINGRRVATSYGAAYANRMFLLKTGYDPELAECSPFKVLAYHALQSAFEEGLCEVDFLGNSEPWKREWTSTARPHDWLFIFSNSRRARLLHSIKFQVVPELKRWRH